MSAEKWQMAPSSKKSINPNTFSSPKDKQNFLHCPRYAYSQTGHNSCSLFRNKKNWS